MFFFDHVPAYKTPVGNRDEYHAAASCVEQKPVELDQKGQVSGDLLYFAATADDELFLQKHLWLTSIISVFIGITFIGYFDINDPVVAAGGVVVILLGKRLVHCVNNRNLHFRICFIFRLVILQLVTAATAAASVQQRYTAVFQQRTSFLIRGRKGSNLAKSPLFVQI